MHHGFAYGAAYTLTPAQPPAGLSYLPASPHRSPTTHQDPKPTHHQPKPPVNGRGLYSGVLRGRCFAGTGISTRCPSTTPLGLALGPDSPRADKLDSGTLGHPAAGFLTLLSLLMPAFSLVRAPRPVTLPLPRTHDAPLPIHTPEPEPRRDTWLG